MTKCIWFIASLLFIPFVASYAGSIRCGSCLVNEGEDKSQLYLCCGAPDMQSSNYQFVNRPWGVMTVTTDYFTYNCGSSRFIQKVRMEDDRIVSIDNLGWGKGPQKCF